MHLLTLTSFTDITTLPLWLILSENHPAQETKLFNKEKQRHNLPSMLNTNTYQD